MADKLSDEQIIERCRVAGIKWLPPDLPGEDDYEIGFPGSFDMVSMDQMRELLAASPVPAISESDVLRHRAVAAEAQLERAIKILTRIHSFLLPNDVRLPDGRVFQFNNPEVEHEMLRGLRDAIRAVPDEIAAIEAARAGGES